MAQFRAEGSGDLRYFGRPLRTGLSAGAVVIFGAAVTSQTACDLCGNTDAKEYVSPDHAAKVVVFTRDCRATTDVSTHASILRASASMPADKGNAFIADSNRGKAPTALEVTWRDARTVELSRHADARVFKAVSSVNGINIVYTTWR